MRASQQMLANRLKVSVSTVQHILSGLRNASAPVADRLSETTESPFRIWLKGGDLATRQAAFAAWAASAQK